MQGVLGKEREAMITNGNGKQRWIFWLVGTITTILITLFLFMGKAVIANDQLSRTRDKDVASEARLERNELRKEVKSDLKDMKHEILAAITELKDDIKAIN